MADYQEAPCHVCGSQTYSWGVIEGRQRHKFKLDERPAIDKFMNTGGYSVRARACKICGNIQLFIRE